MPCTDYLRRDRSPRRPGPRDELATGFGTGYWLHRLIAWGAQPQHVTGIDLLRDRVRRAARLGPRDIGMFCSSAVALPFRSASCDLVMQFMVFTSILDADVRRWVAEEMDRVLTPEG